MYDAIANSYFAKLLIKNSFSYFPKTMGFYQPGGAILTSVYSLFMKYNFPKALLYLTIFSISLSSHYLIYFIAKLTKNFFLKTKHPKKNNYFSFLSFVFLSWIISFILIHWTITLYLVGSKNSYLISLPYTFFYFLIFYTALKKKNKPYLTIFFILITFTTMVHYTSPFFALPIIFVLGFKYLSVFTDKKFFFIFLLSLFVTVIFFILFFLLNKYGIESTKLAINHNFKINLSLKDFIRFIKLVFFSTQNEVSFLVFFGFLISLISLFIKRSTLFGLLSISSLIWFYLYTKIPISVIKTYTVQYNFKFLTFFLAITTLSFFYKRFFKYKFLLTLFLVWMLIFPFFHLNFEIKTALEDISHHSLVSKNDLKSFNWIDKNLDKNKLFFPVSFDYQKKIKKIFEHDGTAYLKVFTDFQSCPAYVEGENSYDCTKELYNLLVKSNLDITHPKVKKYFNKWNIKYFYYNENKILINKKNKQKNSLTLLKYSPDFNLIYNASGVKIFELK